MLQDIAGAQQEQAQPQKLTASQAAAQSADARQQPGALASARWGSGPAASTPRTPIFGVTRCGAHSPIRRWRGIGVRLRRHRCGQAKPWTSPGLAGNWNFWSGGPWWWSGTSKLRSAILVAQPTCALQNLSPGTISYCVKWERVLYGWFYSN